MERSEILKQAIEKAVSNGYEMSQKAFDMLILLNMLKNLY